MEGYASSQLLGICEEGLYPMPLGAGWQHTIQDHFSFIPNGCGWNCALQNVWVGLRPYRPNWMDGACCVKFRPECNLNRQDFLLRKRFHADPAF